jgi:hypothetical protein
MSKVRPTISVAQAHYTKIKYGDGNDKGSDNKDSKCKGEGKIWGVQVHGLLLLLFPFFVG